MFKNFQLGGFSRKGEGIAIDFVHILKVMKYNAIVIFFISLSLTLSCSRYAAKFAKSLTTASGLEVIKSFKLYVFGIEVHNKLNGLEFH